MKKVNQTFKKERKETDDSLLKERGKTDVSFDKGRNEAYNNTDEIVSKDRLEADTDRLKKRSNADLAQEKSKTNILNKPDQKTELALFDQRISEDNAIEFERLNMDKALHFERREKEVLMNKLVGLERLATDKNLLGERIKTDLVTEHSAGLLTAEHAEHLKTKSALTTRDEFVAIVSHDLRNPIGTILSSADMLLEGDLQEKVSGITKNLIQMIKRNAETSLRLIGDILDMERIVEGKMQLHFTINNIDEIIQDTLESYSHVASTNKIALKMQPSNAGEVKCDKDRVAQILSNLIGNALKFTPENGSVVIESTDSSNEIVVSVRDTGPGIPEDQKQKIFDRFAQLNNKQRSGIGLGLYISKTLVESHAGKLWVTSTFGQGSTFSFTLPKSNIA